jgi:serine/threonine protein kinase
LSSSEIGRKFHFIRQIASGGFGSVYLAKVVHGDGFARLAAVKMLHPRWSENEDVASRMRDEARLLGWLRHRNIVEVFDLTRIEGRVAVIMEYLEAVDAKLVVAHCLETGTVVPLRAACEICACVASALDAAYNRPPYAGERPLRVIHRDIKPSNIMIDNAGTVKVLDFGVARAEFDERETKTQEIHYGSLEYMPPERLFYEPDSDLSDVYSLGVTLYELLTLEKLGKAKTRPELHTQLLDERFQVLADRRAMPEELWSDLRALLAAMAAFDDEDRPNAAECVTRLRALGRRCGDEGTEEWAEGVIPALVHGASARQQATPSELADKVMTEDSRGFRTDDGALAGLGPDEPELDAELSESDRLANEKWNAQKQAYVAMADIGAFTPSPPPSLTGATPRTPPPEPTQEVEPERSSRISGAVLAMFAGGALLLVFGVVLIATALVGGTALYTEDSEQPLAPATEGPVEPADAPTAPPFAPSGPAATFESALEGTSKVVVRCDGGEAVGDVRASVSGEALGACTVTAQTADRRRVTAVIDEVELRVYRCFVDGGKLCE